MCYINYLSCLVGVRVRVRVRFGIFVLAYVKQMAMLAGNGLDEVPGVSKSWGIGKLVLVLALETTLFRTKKDCNGSA